MSSSRPYTPAPDAFRPLQLNSRNHVRSVHGGGGEYRQQPTQPPQHATAGYRGMPYTDEHVQRRAARPTNDAPTSPVPQQPLPATPKAAQYVQRPASPAESVVALETAEDDPYDAPPAQSVAHTPTPGSPVYGGIIDEAASAISPAAKEAATAPAADSTAQPAQAPEQELQAQRPVSVVIPATGAVVSPAGAPDVEIEVRGAIGARVVTIRLRS